MVPQQVSCPCGCGTVHYWTEKLAAGEPSHTEWRAVLVESNVETMAWQMFVAGSLSSIPVRAKENDRRDGDSSACGWPRDAGLNAAIPEGVVALR
jgi:hypothetical protein